MSLVRSSLVALALCAVGGVGCAVEPLGVPTGSSSTHTDNGPAAKDTTPCSFAYQYPADTSAIDCTGAGAGSGFAGSMINATAKGVVLSDGSQTEILIFVPFSGTEQIGEPYTFDRNGGPTGGADAAKWAASMSNLVENGETPSSVLYSCSASTDSPTTTLTVTYSSIENTDKIGYTYQTHGTIAVSMSCARSANGDTQALGMVGKITLTF